MVRYMRTNRTSLLRVIVVVVLGMVVAANLVPYTVLVGALRRYALMRELADVISCVAPGFDLDHLLAFGTVGFAAHFGWNKLRVWRAALGLLAIAALVEFLQIWIPGRVPAISHAIVDVVGGVAGFGLASLFTYAWGTHGTVMGHPHSAICFGESRFP
jgi:hypothetical protein